MSKETITKISQWIQNKDGLYLMENPSKETEKAICFKVEKWNCTATKLNEVDCWFPKSKTLKVENDYYLYGQSHMYLVPIWLINSKQSDGYNL